MKNLFIRANEVLSEETRRRLGELDVRIAATQGRVETQKKLLATLQANGLDTVMARNVLASLQESLDGFKALRASIVGGISEYANERSRIVRGLKESEAKFRTITNAMPQMVWTARRDGTIEYHNERFYDFVGLPSSRVEGNDWLSLLHPDDRTNALQTWQHSIDYGTPYETTYRIRHHSGEYRWILARAMPVLDDNGAILKWMGTNTDIHEKKTAEEALHESSRRKDEFLAMLAHELRNPLAPISTAAEVLMLVAHDPENVKRTGRLILRQVRHMTNLVNDLLDVSRVTRGLVQLSKEDLELNGVVRAALEQVRPLIEERHHALQTVIAPEPLFVHADRTRLVQVISNLLSNAAKYTPDSGHIVLRVEPAGSKVRITVTDDGIGIDPSLLPRVFDLFTQAERTSDRSQGGLGIGLALVKSMVAMHDGDTEAHSDGLGKGSTFTIELPLLDTKAQAGGLESARKSPDAREALRILVVDDNADAARSLAELLRIRGNEVNACYSGSQALAIVDTFEPDLCVLDIGMPEMDGYELVQQLRQRPSSKDAVFVALTGYGQAHDKARSVEAGFDHHFIKPIDIAQLQTIIAAMTADSSRHLPGIDAGGMIGGSMQAVQRSCSVQPGTR